MKSGKKVLGIVLTLVLFIALLAVAAPFVFPGIYTVYQSPEKVLKNRATGLMEAMVARDWRACAEFVAGSDGEVQLVSDNHFLEGFEVGQISVSGDDATVMVHVDFRMNIPQVPQMANFPLSLDQTQKWKKQGFTWYLQYEPVTFRELFKTDLGGNPAVPGSPQVESGEATNMSSPEGTNE